MNYLLGRPRWILNLIIPKEFGRLIYIGIFYFMSFAVRLQGKNLISIWYRNSLLQDYFSFAFSDIDISISLKSNLNISAVSREIQATLFHCPLIKEINVYYPFCLNQLPQLANKYEFSKDINLFRSVVLNTKSSEYQKGEKLSYLLRMYFSNLKQLKNGLSNRDLAKWEFHFFKIEKIELSHGLKTVRNETDLLKIILSGFPELDESYLTTLIHVSRMQNLGEPLHLQFQQSPYQEKLFCLMPHLFCFTGLVFRGESTFCENIFVSQISWEVMGMLTQPSIFSGKKSEFQHLDNLKSTINGSVLVDDSCHKQSLNLTKAIEEYIEILGF